MADLSKIAVSNNEYDIPQGGSSATLIMSKHYYAFDSLKSLNEVEIPLDDGLYIVTSSFHVGTDVYASNASIRFIHYYKTYTDFTGNLYVTSSIATGWEKNLTNINEFETHTSGVIQIAGFGKGGSLKLCVSITNGLSNINNHWLSYEVARIG